jgi:hypothetical protein
MEVAAIPGFVAAVAWAAICAVLVGALMAPSALATRDPLRKGIGASMAFATFFVIGGLAMAQILAWFGMWSQTDVTYSAILAPPSWLLGFIFGIPLTCIAVWWLRSSYRGPRIQTSMTVIRILAAGLVTFAAIDLLVSLARQ